MAARDSELAVAGAALAQANSEKEASLAVNKSILPSTTLSCFLPILTSVVTHANQ
jgi:hypothetical protein